MMYVIHIFYILMTDEDTRSELLQCFVPRVKISADTLNALLVWYFSNYASSTNNAQSFLSWLSGECCLILTLLIILIGNYFRFQ